MNEKWNFLFKEMKCTRHEMSLRIGCALPQLSNAIHNTAYLPKKYWKKVVEVTNGYITMADLYRSWFAHLKDKVSVEVFEGEDPWTCIIKEKPPAE